LCPVLNGAMYLVCENILSTCNRAPGLPESSRCALAADAMEDFASIRCTPSSPPEARRAPNPRRFPPMSRTPLSCFPGVPISSSKIASKYLLSQCSLAWVASLLPHVWQAPFSAALPLPFLHKRIFRLSLTLLLDKNKLMLSFRRLRRNSRSKFESSFLKGKLRIRQLRGQNLLGSFLFPLAEPDFLSDVQVDTPKTPAVHRHTTQARLALRE
jgi:hypothetical protein